jgi:hypothetical protein
LVANEKLLDSYYTIKVNDKEEKIIIIRESAVITVRNCHANVVDEHLRLEVDKWAKIEPSLEKIASVNTANNLSDTEYELVSVRK